MAELPESMLLTGLELLHAVNELLAWPDATTKPTVAKRREVAEVFCGS